MRLSDSLCETNDYEDFSLCGWFASANGVLGVSRDEDEDETKMGQDMGYIQDAILAIELEYAAGEIRGLQNNEKHLQRSICLHLA